MLYMLMLAAGGCYDRIELNELAIADIMAIDLTEDGLLRVSMQFIVPSELTNPGGVGAGSGLRDPFYVIEAVGETVPEALSLLQAKVPRRLFTSHVRVIVLGEDLARAGIGPVFDSLTRMRELRVSADVIVTKGEGATLLRAAPRLGRLPVSALANMLHQRIVPTRTIRQVAIALASDGIDPFIPAVGLAPRIETELEAGVRAQEFELEGVGIFRGDRLVGFATLEQARGLAWLVNEAPFAVATIQWPPEGGPPSPPAARPDVSPEEALIQRDAPPGFGPDALGGGLKEPNQISPQVLRAKVDLRSEIKDGQVVIHVHARAVDDIVTNQAGLNLMDPKVIPELEKALATSVEERMRAMLRLAQEELEADVMGFGALVRRQHPKEWRELRQNWHAHFRQVPVHISVEVKVRRTGLTGNPAPFRPEQMRE
ncbi:MAG: hypothetical protein BAA04_00980 [Firmicutes bacterium ZCTH02-B6]|nr:MAG: hypothetical protein BAA04_00980 [Firmicutes bacterium ZCTH02-B6]